VRSLECCPKSPSGRWICFAKIAGSFNFQGAKAEYVNYDLFDVILFSAEEGLTKPASRFYEMAAMKMDVSPKECIFIDDNIDNVRGAVAIGMKGIQYVDGDQIKKEIMNVLT